MGRALSRPLSDADRGVTSEPRRRWAGVPTRPCSKSIAWPLVNRKSSPAAAPLRHAIGAVLRMDPAQATTTLNDFVNAYEFARHRRENDAHSQGEVDCPKLMLNMPGSRHDSSPTSWGSVSRFFVNLTTNPRALSSRNIVKKPSRNGTFSQEPTHAGQASRHRALTGGYMLRSATGRRVPRQPARYQGFSVPVSDGVSPTTECHQQRSVTNNGVSPTTECHQQRSVTNNGVSPTTECHQQRSVTNNGVSPTTECHQQRSVTNNGVSPTTECHQQRSVTNNGVSPTTECHQQRSVTNNGVSPTTECHQQRSVTNNGVSPTTECHQQRSVTNNGVSPTTECHQQRSVTNNGVSPTTECHQQRSVTNNGVSPTTECHQQRSVTNNGVSPTTECHQQRSVTNNGVSPTTECHQQRSVTNNGVSPTDVLRC